MSHVWCVRSWRRPVIQVALLFVLLTSCGDVRLVRGSGPLPKAVKPLVLQVASDTKPDPVSTKAPAKLLDLARWKLTLPVDTDRPGHPDEIEPAELAAFIDSTSFFVDEKAEGVVFRARCGGSTTKGSKYPRCELREVNERGDDAAWATDDGGVHTLSVKLAINKTPPVKAHVVCAQIHAADDDLMMVRLEGKKLFVERNSLGDVSLDANYKLGSPFDVKIQAGAGQVQVWYNGELKMTWKIASKGCYFKAGCYTQSNVSKGDAADSFGDVVIQRLQIEHRSRK